MPGLLREKLIAMIKGLPKSLRKQLVPAPDVADALLERLSAGDEPLAQALSRELKGLRGIRIFGRLGAGGDRALLSNEYSRGR